MEDGIAEKRLHQRIDKSFTARFKEEGSPHWDIVILQSLSAGGALFKFNRKLPIGSRVDLRINFPFYDVSAISCAGTIVRIEEPVKKPILHVAVQFSDIGDKEKDAIKKSAEDFCSRKTEPLQN